MSEQYFTKMKIPLVVSALIFGISLVPAAPAYVSVFGIGPLLYYHWLVLTPAAKEGLSSTAIDSVYYFGFLITVLALAITALHIGFSAEQTNVTTVVVHFGLGLIATGYAVFARMHLNSLAPSTGTFTEEQIMDRYVQRSAQLIDHIETSTSKLSTFAIEIVAQTAASAETIQQTAEQNMRRTSEAFAKDIATILADVRAAMNGIQQLVTDPSSKAARERFNTELRDTYQASAQLNVSMGELAKRTAEEAHQRTETVAATRNLALHLQDFSGKVKALGATDGAIAVSAQALGEVSGDLVSSSRTVVAALDELKQVGRLVQDTGPTFVKMRTITNKVTEQLETLADATGHLRTAGENVQFATDASSALNGELVRMREILPMVAAGGQQLAATLETAGTSTRVFEQKIAAVPHGLDAIQALQLGMTAALEQLTAELKTASQHASQVREHGAVGAAAVDGANALLAGAARLDDTVGSIQQRLSGLLDAIGAVNAAIHTTSEGLQSYAASYRNQPPAPAPGVLPRTANPQLSRPEETLP